MSFTLRMMATLAAAALSTTVLAAPVVAQDIEIREAYAVSASPTARIGAAFMEIVNDGEEDRLTGVASPAAAMVELHASTQGDDGAIQMRHIEEGLVLPAHGTLTLGLGSNHVMLVGLVAPFSQGDIVPITFSFEKAGDITVDVPVDLERLPDMKALHGGANHGQ